MSCLCSGKWFSEICYRQALMMKSAVGDMYWQNPSCNPETQFGNSCSR
jgi:hypothetical protein